LALTVALRPKLHAPAPLGTPHEAAELIVAIYPGPIFYFRGPDSSLVGYDVDLLRQFAAENHLPLRFVRADSVAQVMHMVANGDAHIGAGGMYAPAASATKAKLVAKEPSSASAPNLARDILWTTGYASAEPVLIYSNDGFKPTSWNDLDGESITYAEDSGFESEIATVRSAHPGIKWNPLPTPPAGGLVAQVSEGSIDYAIVGSLAAALERNIYLEFDVAFPVGGKREIAWAVPARFAALKQELDQFLAKVRKDGTLARLAERYVPDASSIQRIDAGALHDRVRTHLPRYRSLFHEAQEKTNIEWRLLAAISYQESKWDPEAQSDTGVRGLMQITEDTAKHLGINNLLDPAQNVLGAARYLRLLKDKLPAKIDEPDRTWLALAAFNIGFSHLEDARVLAQKLKLDPNRWRDIKKVLPLLALPEYYSQAKQGYARGGMPVAFVDRVRGYYDVLLAQQEPYRPRLRSFSELAR
jgi:membrane-bound lytic murein transglycosylase F